MELHQLRYLLAVVDEGGFTAAADVVHISQSGVSTQIQKLERELGVVLIDRSARRVALTPSGEQLLPYARAAVAAVDDVRAAADAISGLTTGVVRVGTVTGLAWPRLFDALAAVHTDHPGIDLRLSEATSEELITAVRDGALDVAVAAWAGDPPDGVQYEVVVDDPLVAVVAPDHPWAGRTRIQASSLTRADLIALPPGTGARTALDALLRRADAPDVQPRWEVATPAYVQLLAGRGIGVGIASATTAADWSDVAVLPISDKAARSTLGVAWQRRPSHAARALLRLLID